MRCSGEKLLDARPDYGWLSEETPDDPDDRIGKARTFMLDPIDGTAALIGKSPQWTISIGLVEGERAFAGAIYNPMTDEMFVGADRRTARRSTAGRCARTHARHARRRAHDRPDEPLRADKRWPTPWPKMDVIERQSIAYRMALVAAGMGDATLLFGFKHEWDIAAGAAIVEAAGGVRHRPLGRAARASTTRSRARRALRRLARRLHALLIERTKAFPDPREQHGKAHERTTPTLAPCHRRRAEGPRPAGIRRSLRKVDFVGAYPNYRAAYDAWKGAAQRTVDNARMRYFIIHAHRLLDPETDNEHEQVIRA